MNEKIQLLQPTTASATDDFERDYSCRMTTATEKLLWQLPLYACSLFLVRPSPPARALEVTRHLQVRARAHRRGRCQSRVQPRHHLLP
jgi:hypothetical protein